MAHTYRCFWARARAHPCNHVRSQLCRGKFAKWAAHPFRSAKMVGGRPMRFFHLFYTIPSAFAEGKTKACNIQNDGNRSGNKKRRKCPVMCMCMCVRLLKANITASPKTKFWYTLHSQKFVIHILICARRCYIHKIFNYSIYTLFVWFVFV